MNAISPIIATSFRRKGSYFPVEETYSNFRPNSLRIGESLVSLPAATSPYFNKKVQQISTVESEQTVAEPDNVTWSGFEKTITGLLSITLVVMSGALTWLKSDISDMRTDVKEIRAAASSVDKQVSTLGGKFDMFVEDSKKRR